MAKDVVYYGELITPNKVITKDGYIICMNVPIARIGYQEYLDTELKAPSIAMDKVPGINRVYREESEVFDEKTIASFEAMPVTDDHPRELVNADNWNLYAKGTATNVRRGVGEDSDKIVADIHINDKALVTVVENKMKEQISCGYTCDWVYEDGVIKQKNIRGNHVAIVQRGRAGIDIAIRDELPEILQESVKDEESEVLNKPMDLMKKVLDAIFGVESADKVDSAIDIYNSISNVVADKAIDVEDKEVNTEMAEDVKVDIQNETVIDVAPSETDKKLDSIADSLDKLINVLTANVAADKSCDPVEDEKDMDDKDDKDDEKDKADDEDMVKKSVESASESAANLEELFEKVQSTVDENKANVVSDAAVNQATLNILNAMKMPIAAIKNDKDRTMVADSLLSVISSMDSAEIVPDNTIADVMKIVNDNAAEMVANDGFVYAEAGINGIAGKAKIEQDYYNQSFEKGGK